MAEFNIHRFPKTRIATNDVCEMGRRKHHVVALAEVDVTGAREKIRQHRRQGERISFTAWLIKVISSTVGEYAGVASYLKGKREQYIFSDINVSLAVEKSVGGQNVPIPLVIEKAGEKSIEAITAQIEEARNQVLTEQDIVLQNRSSRLEHLYYGMPGFVRRAFWKYLLRHPKFAFRKMGNVAITSVGMKGRAGGWFIPIAVHPVCFGIGNITKKPVVVDDQIVIREMLAISILMDHDVTDGVYMAKFIGALTENISNGSGL